MRYTCLFCNLPIEYADKFARFMDRPCHYDCLVQFELDQREDEELRRRA